MTNSINKVRTAGLILDAICKELGSEAPEFCECFEQHNNPVVVVIDAYENLGYRDKVILGMRLGFVYGYKCTNQYAESKKKPYRDCANTFQLACDSSASRIYKKAIHRLSMAIMTLGNETAEVE